MDTLPINTFTLNSNMNKRQLRHTLKLLNQLPKTNLQMRIAELRLNLRSNTLKINIPNLNVTAFQVHNEETLSTLLPTANFGSANNLGRPRISQLTITQRSFNPLMQMPHGIITKISRNLVQTELRSAFKRQKLVDTLMQQKNTKRPVQLKTSKLLQLLQQQRTISPAQIRQTSNQNIPATNLHLLMLCASANTENLHLILKQHMRRHP